MSTQRRRVLENSGLIIPADGVYIEGLDGRAYTVDKWKGGNAANSVIVASGDVKFRVALTEAPSTMCLSSGPADPLEKYMTFISSSATALSNYDGAGNTAKIMQIQPSTDYAAGYCNAFVFPDGKTKGYLPSLGQLYLVQKNKAAVTMALRKCNGAELTKGFYYWSSTFKGVDSIFRQCWMLRYNVFNVYYMSLDDKNYVRPFADIS